MRILHPILAGAISLAASACTISLPFQYDESIVADVDQSFVLLSDICRNATPSNYQALKTKYDTLIDGVTAAEEKAKSRPKAASMTSFLGMTVSATKAVPVSESPPPMLQISTTSAPAVEKTCQPPGEADIDIAKMDQDNSARSLELAVLTLQSFEQCHKAQFLPPSARSNPALGSAVQQIGQQMLLEGYCGVTSVYLRNARSVEKSLETK
ncbi:MAG TPA: hypothetical protein VEH07_04645 [Alphaproteobacteria bacterium]|nr:hypothetical protein [Alphaproteobacteria bacterium]